MKVKKTEAKKNRYKFSVEPRDITRRRTTSFSVFNSTLLCLTIEHRCIIFYKWCFYSSQISTNGRKISTWLRIRCKRRKNKVPTYVVLLTEIKHPIDPKIEHLTHFIYIGNTSEHDGKTTEVKKAEPSRILSLGVWLSVSKICYESTNVKF